MLADALIDTGAIPALLDRTDRWHEPCVEAFHPLRLPLLNSEAVLAELFRPVSDERRVNRVDSLTPRVHNFF